uniref:Uncharacterized protein n=1 Tax=Chenopodium quinoa TaxID=63459 RepID=A0A803L635_CHEQI
MLEEEADQRSAEPEIREEAGNEGHVEEVEYDSEELRSLQGSDEEVDYNPYFNPEGKINPQTGTSTSQTTPSQQSSQGAASSPPQPTQPTPTPQPLPQTTDTRKSKAAQSKAKLLINPTPTADSDTSLPSSLSQAKPRRPPHETAAVRFSISPMVQALLCTQDWLRAKEVPIVDVEENLKELEEIEKGQFVTEVHEDKHESVVYVDCNKGPGARFIHADLNMTISDILSPKDVPLVVQSLFDLNEKLVSVEVTELIDGIFIACTVNHSVTDGTSYWHFWNIWSKIHRGNGKDTICESDLPVYTRWYPDGHAPGPYPIPFIHPDEFVRKFEPPQLRDRIFHFSSESIARRRLFTCNHLAANNRRRLD